MISRCSDTRDRNRNRSEWSSEKTTEATKRGYRRTPATSIDATRTEFSVGTTTVGLPHARFLQQPFLQSSDPLGDV
jgi:hypothetical protein